MSEPSSDTGVEAVGDGEFMPIGTIPTSSGRSEGEGVVRVGPEESDVGVLRVTASELVWAKEEKLSISVIKKKPPQRGRSKWNSRITKQFRISTKINFRS